jgi:hypothetical protein
MDFAPEYDPGMPICGVGDRLVWLPKQCGQR